MNCFLCIQNRLWCDSLEGFGSFPSYTQSTFILCVCVCVCFMNIMTGQTEQTSAPAQLIHALSTHTYRSPLECRRPFLLDFFCPIYVIFVMLAFQRGSYIKLSRSFMIEEPSMMDLKWSQSSCVHWSYCHSSGGETHTHKWGSLWVQSQLHTFHQTINHQSF